MAKRRLSPRLQAIRHVAEAALMWSLYHVVRLFPLDAASNFGAWLFGRIGPKLWPTRTALINLAIAFPEHSDGARADIMRQMWENLGRVIFEFPFVNTSKMSQRIEIVGAEYVQDAKDTGRPIIFVSGHMGNWELAAKTAFLIGTPLILIYRASNNKLTDKLIHKVRGNFYAGLYAKGPKAAIRVVKALRQNKAVGMLIDQKMNDGIPVPFFGQPAMTAPAIAEFVFRYNAIVIPSRVVRTHGAHFKTIIEPPMQFERTGDNEADTLRAMTQVNQHIEKWIREYPSQWFWVHKRFAKDNYRKPAP